LLTSGKSSLTLTILRMLELSAGTITIDGVDISTIPREEVRQRLNSIPQEAFFLPGTLRDNVDPLGRKDDEQIIAVLSELGLWESLEATGGLDGDMDEDSLSHGQRQLLCLARAVIRRGQIIILDEATSR
jgi:ATP-binding cassette subfamily C (CFTR/MRP) protein 1